MTRASTLLRLLREDNLQMVDASPVDVLWGVAGPVTAVTRRRGLLRTKHQAGDVPFLPCSPLWAVRCVSQNTKGGRKAVEAAKVAQLARRDGWTCLYCGCRVHEHNATVEHFIPRSAGGPDHGANLFLACGPCNAHAGDMSAAEKLAFRDELRASILISQIQEAA
jgi:5-methylcytosine-specific restriction endonuclease McrA